VTVDAEPEALALLLHNLLGNAVDFAPAGSAIELELQRHGLEATVTVRDHGPGVPEALLAQLGEPFVASTKPNGRKGSGLGLAIARQVATLHRGGLAFDNAQPGFRVRFTLPSHSP
jgi:two-component system sensor histidine kinase CreC